MARRRRTDVDAVAPATAPSRRPSAVDPSLRLSVALGASLLLWWSTASATLAGRVDVVVAGGRYLAALLVAWVGTGLIVRVVDAYATSAAAGDPPPEPASAAPDATPPVA